MNAFPELDVGSPHVILVSGAARAGKSALIRHVLRAAGARRVASLEPASEWSSLRAHGAGGPPRPLDQLLIELPVGADPTQYRRDAGVAEGDTVSSSETVITVVNAESVLADFCSHELIRSRIPGLPIDDLRSVADVLTDQIESAHVLVLNKTDRVRASQSQGLKALLTVLNPGAALLPAVHGQVPPEVLLSDASLNAGQQPVVPGWKRALNGESFPNEDVFGISSLVYRERRPFHPQRLHEFFGESWTGVVRSRGFFWLASRPEWAAELSQAGAARRYRAVSTWWAESLAGRSHVPDDVSGFLGVPWHPRFGDRRQELVFVGIGLDAMALKVRLDECLLTEDELRGDLARWRSLDDPFPLWAEPVRPRGSASTH
jgi:G3E family GTPase